MKVTGGSKQGQCVRSRKKAQQEILGSEQVSAESRRNVLDQLRAERWYLGRQLLKEHICGYAESYDMRKRSAKVIETVRADSAGTSHIAT